MKCETAFLQDRRELQRFVELLKQENVKSYLEIGSKFGGSLWHIASSLPTGSKIVVVDLPHGDGSFKESQPHLQQCVDELRKRYDHQVALILGDSTDRDIVDEVDKLAPFDACFIDGNHTEPYIRKDWENYGPMCRIVAFHDIGFLKERGETSKKPIEVPKVWNEIKKDFRHTEIMLDLNKKNGIGVLWMS